MLSHRGSRYRVAVRRDLMRTAPEDGLGRTWRCWRAQGRTVIRPATVDPVMLANQAALVLAEVP